MFYRMLIESLMRRGSRKLLAALAVWIGVTLVVALLALSLDVGDKMNRELRSFGANIKLEPASAAILVRVGGHELAAAVQPAFLQETQPAFAGSALPPAGGSAASHQWFHRRQLEGRLGELVPRPKTARKEQP